MKNENRAVQFRAEASARKCGSCKRGHPAADSEASSDSKEGMSDFFLFFLGGGGGGGWAKASLVKAATKRKRIAFGKQFPAWALRSVSQFGGLTLTHWKMTFKIEKGLII